MRKKVQKEAIKELARAYEKNNREKRVILLLSVILSVALIFGVFSLTLGKINTDTIRNVREDGIGTTTYLENATEDDAENLARLTYINKVGKEKRAGGLYEGDKKISSCIVTDQETYHNMIKQAYTDIQGKYPIEGNEIMLSMDTLEYLGIAEPQIGMELSVDYQWDDFMLVEHSGQHIFILSGYFQDYSIGQSEKAKSFVSYKMLEEAGGSWYPLRLLMDIKPDYLSGKQIEERLYNDVELKEAEQQFISTDSAAYRAMQNTLGGYGLSICLAIMILLSMFLLVYNVLFISLNKEVQQYGLMEVLGVTYQQIKTILLWQNLRVWLTGSLLGGAVSLVLVLAGLPFLLRKMYLGNSGTMENIKVFYPEVLAIAVIFTGLALFAATGLVIKKLKRLSPLEAMKFEETDSSYGREKMKNKKRKNGTSIGRMAVRNVMRSKRKFMVTVISLALGCEIGLCSIVIMNGTDIIHKLEKNPDFKIGTTKEVCAAAPLMNDSEMVNSAIFKEEQIEALRQQIGLDEKSIKRISGSLVNIDEEAEKVIDVLNNYRDCTLIIEGIDNEKMEGLQEYVKKQSLNIEADKFENEDGVLIAHHHLMQSNDKYSMKEIGKHMKLYKPVLEGEPVDKDKGVDLVNCGYLDLKEKKLPELNIAWDNEDVIYFLVSEKTLDKITEIIPRQVFNVQFNVEKSQEAEIKKAIHQWVKSENIKFQNDKMTNYDLFYVTCKSDIISEEKDYMEGSRMIMLLVSAILIFIGLMNYLNTIIAGIFKRKREFAVMESVGMTRKQLRKMLILEGAYYCVAVIGIVVTFGTLGIAALGKIMSSGISYFEYAYPYQALIIMVFGLLFICIMIPRLVYTKSVNESVVERLRKSVDK